MDKLYIVRYGIGYGEHELDIIAPEDMDMEEVEEIAGDAVRERLWWAVSLEDEDEE